MEENEESVPYEGSLVERNKEWLRLGFIVDPIKDWETEVLIKEHSHTLETMPVDPPGIIGGLRQRFMYLLARMSETSNIKYDELFENTVPEWIPPFSCLEEMDLDELQGPEKRKKKRRIPMEDVKSEKIKWRHYSEEEYDKILWPMVQW